MRKIFSSMLLLLMLTAMIPLGIRWTEAASAAATESPPFDTSAAVETLKRLVPKHYEQVRLVAVNRDKSGDNFHILSKDGLVEIQGTSPAVLLTGFNWYLKYVAKANINWNGEQLNLPQQLPLPVKEIVQQANVPHRFALNDTDDGYTGAYRNWQDWERMIDVLALNGINEVLVTVGQEAVYYDTFQEFGYSAQEMNNWITLPAHQPWWLLQNMCCFAGPNSENLINERAVIGKKIADRLRELGMTPVFPGYFGTVPTKFVEKNPTGRVISQGTWVGFNRPDWLDPRNALFPKIAEAFYRNQTERFGDTTMFKMDLLHEGGNAGDVPVGTASKAVETALQAAHPGAIWTILGWQSNPSSTLLAPLDKTKLLVLDGLSDRYANLNREQSWPGVPYAFGSIWNFGGHTTMGANLSDWNTKYWQWKAKSGSKLNGIALMPEGSENNPVAFDFFTEIAWQQGPVDLPNWFGTWAERRYGGGDENAKAAWETLRQTAYNMPAGEWSEAQDGLFGAQPSLTANKAASWSPESMRYDGVVFDLALPAMLNVRQELRSSSAYRYDLMDITRQVLSNHSRVLLPQIKQEYDAKDKLQFNALTDKWLKWMELLDEVTATNKQTMLGPWLDNAKSFASDDAERARLEFDARSLLTVWGDRSGSTSGGLHDYANREWSGLVGDYYYLRWKTYFDELKGALAEGRQPGQIDWFAIGDAWSKRQNIFPTEPQGDIHLVAQKVLDEISNSSSLGITVTADKAAIVPGATVTITATLKNENSFLPAQGVNVSIAPNQAFNVKALTATMAEQVNPGKTFTVKFEITAADEFSNSSLIHTLTVESTYRYGTVGQTAKGTINLLASKGVTAPYQTVSFNNSQFAQSGNSFGIYGGGSDLWGASQGFGSIFLDKALSSDTTVTTKVVHQDNTWGWARAGIIARNDLRTNGSAGYVNIAVTPSNGCAFSWDQNGDGQLESVSSKAGFTAPVYVKLARTGSTITGACSSDGIDWTTIGTATLASAAVKQDVGLFMSAVNVTSQLNGFVEFEGLEVNSQGVLVTGLTLDKPQVTLNLDTNKSTKLNAIIAPLNASNKNVVWSSSKEEVAKVDSNGTVTAAAIGTATITATTVEGGFIATAEVKVVEAGPFVTEIQLDKTALSLTEGQTSELTVAVLPSNALNPNVTWSTSDPAIALVQKTSGNKAVVTGLQAGKATITVTSIDGGYKATSQVTILPRPANLALNKPATAKNSERPAANGNDGNLTTMWVANSGSAGNWWAVDLGDIYELTGSEIHFEKQVLWKYIIEVSNDNATWVTAVDKMNNTDTSQMQSHSYSTQGRYVRITFDQAPGQNWTAFQELLVFGYPIAPGTTLSGTNSVPAGNEFTIRFGLKNVTQSVYAQDIKLNYDANVMEFVSAKSAKDGISIVDSKDQAGALRLIIASQGAGHAFTGTAEFIDIVFKAKN
ncbi:alpha-N-acetylglucosaminidase TIM-barrel domain-containing protein, partial [Paenibacillus planticolens]